MRNRNPHHMLTADQITAFEEHLRTEEREQTTIEKYMRNIRVFAVWLGGTSVTKSTVIAWKEHLLAKQYAPATVNAALASLNAFFKFTGWEKCRVKALRLQRRVFRDPDRELTRDEYGRLINTAYDSGKNRLGLLMETICATGIRVSEVQYITVGAAQRGKTEISLKGKIRTIMLPGKLCRKLLKYAKKTKNRLRRNLSHQKRKGAVQTADLGGDESALQGCGSSAVQSVPAQSAAPVREGVLPGLPGHRKAGGHSGPLQYWDHAHLPDFHRSGARGSTGPTGPHLLTAHDNRIIQKSYAYRWNSSPKLNNFLEKYKKITPHMEYREKWV